MDNKNLFLIYLGRSGAGPKLTFDFFKETIKNEKINNFKILISDKNKLLKEFQNISNNIETISTPTSTKELILGSIKFTINFYKKLKIAKKNNIKNFFFTMTHAWDIIAMILIKIFIKESNIIYTCHAFSFPTRSKRDFLEKIIVKSECLLSNTILTLSTQVTKEIKEKFPNKKIHTLFHPLYDHKTISSPRHLSSNPTFLLFGRILKYKGLSLLLPAFNKLSEENQSVRLLIAGEGKIEDDEIKLINDINKKYNNITLNNTYIDEKDIDNIWEQIDVSMTPYLNSLQSGVIPIAINKATPSIITPHPALIEQSFINTDHPIALCSKEITIESILEEMKNILEEEKYNELSYNCTYIQKELSWNSFVDKLMLILK